MPDVPTGSNDRQEAPVVLAKRSDVARETGYSYEAVRRWEKKPDYPQYPFTIDQLVEWKKGQRCYFRTTTDGKFRSPAQVVKLAIRIRRVRGKMKQWAAAEKIGCDPSLLSGYESGRLNPSRETIKKIAAVFGVDATWLETGRR